MVGRQSLKKTVPQEPVEPMDVDDNEIHLYDDEEGGVLIDDIYIPPPAKPYCSSESHGPRLIITKIVNENFKSYAGVVELGPFCHRFNSIIGPNGSGKSNVIDSMLFVFGYRAQKIRCKKISVLIHNSSHFPNVNGCRVSIYFRQIVDRPDSDEYDDVPNSEIVISRSAFKDNTSFYTLNNKRVQFKEVGQTLKKFGIDLDHNRFLILQGEVESISMMKAKAENDNECGLLEYLEDIIGTTRYKEPLVKINDRLEVLTEERTQKQYRFNLAERDMNDLKGPMEKAIEYLNLENELTRTHNLHIQKYMSEKNKKLVEFDAENKEAQAEMDAFDEQFLAIKKQISDKEQELKSQIKGFDELCNLKENNDTMIKKLLNKLTEVQEEMKSLNDRRHKLKNQVKTEEKKLSDLVNLPEKNAKEIEECEEKIKDLTEKKNTIEAKWEANLAALKLKTDPLVEQRDSLETELVELSKVVNDTKSDLEITEKELEMVRFKETCEKRKYDTLKRSFDETKVELENSKTKLEELKVSVAEGKTNIVKMEHEQKETQKQEQMISQKLKKQQEEVDVMIDNMQMHKSRNKVLDSLMKQKAEGNIRGILGRLGDLGGIDSKYDVAISTCCGRLDNIVVEKVDDAQLCIEYLKKYNIGRANFIALEKVEHLAAQARRKIKTPENVHRIFDLIRVEDERVLAAFYFSLYDTLVADNLDQATRIAYGAQRYRVVTLKGEMIELTGTMSGGGNQQLRGRMGQSVATKTSKRDSLGGSGKNLEQLQKACDKLRDEIHYLQDLQARMNDDLYKLRQKCRSEEALIKKLSMEVELKSKQLPQIEEHVLQQKQLAENTKSDAKQIAELEHSIESKKTAYENAKANASKISTKVEKLKEKINSAFSSTVGNLNEEKEKIEKQLKSLTMNVYKMRVEINASERNIDKSKDKIQNLKNEIEITEKTIQERVKERDNCQENITDATNQVSELSTKIEEAEEQSKSLKKEIDKLQKEENDGTVARIEIQQKLQNIRKKVADVKEQISHWRKKLDTLVIREIPKEASSLEPLTTYSEEELDKYQLQELQYKISLQEEKLKVDKPDLNAIAEYQKKEVIYLEHMRILEDVAAKRNQMRALYDEVRSKRQNEFFTGFSIIKHKLKEMYRMITQGGDAELEQVDSMDPFTEGVTFTVRPPKKSWKNISNLSGGEKTLSSLALVFALHYYKPSPLYFMDEIDAALDYKNVSIVANYIKDRTKNAQFIIISLRSNMFELSDYLIGIYKVEDCTNSVTMENKQPEY